MNIPKTKASIQLALTSLKLYLEGEGQGLPLKLRQNVVKAIDELNKALAK